MSERPQKRMRLLSEDDDESDSNNSSGGVAIFHKSHGEDELESADLKINEEYARRFEHNQRRAEIHRCMNSWIIIPYHWLTALQ